MLFNFNLYSSLLLIGVVQGGVYSLLLIFRGRKEGARSDYWMAGILFLLVLFVSQWMLGFAGKGRRIKCPTHLLCICQTSHFYFVFV